MAKLGRLPDFRKMYPEASEEVIEVLKETERKMQYQEYDLKAEQTIIDQDAQKIRVIPSREDSYERLLEEHNLPADEEKGILSPSLISTLGERFENQKIKISLKTFSTFPKS